MTWTARASTIAAWTIGLLVAMTGGVSVSAQTAPASAIAQAVPTADALFADASAKEAAVRKVLVAPSPQATVLKAVRTVVGDYENVVRHYPTSGYCDDALWRAATLARDAFEEFGESRERTSALRLLKLLASQYPSSRLAKAAPAQITWFETHPARAQTAPAGTAQPSVPPSTITTPGVGARPTTNPPIAAPVADAVPKPGRAVASSKLVNIKGIRRAVLKDVVRIVIEMDDEVAFHDERIDGPPRVFVDLASTRSNPALIDQTLRFDADDDVVRQIRIGRHPNAVTRVVPRSGRCVELQRLSALQSLPPGDRLPAGVGDGRRQHGRHPACAA
ncbi:MAG: AMIN domain-containing protein [Vicinamibacterales bacterium]